MTTKAKELCDQLAAGFALLQVTHNINMSKAAELLNELTKEIDRLQDEAWKAKTGQ